jgi:hypothetical protein
MVGQSSNVNAVWPQARTARERGEKEDAWLSHPVIPKRHSASKGWFAVGAAEPGGGPLWFAGA